MSVTVQPRRTWRQKFWEVASYWPVLLPLEIPISYAMGSRTGDSSSLFWAGMSWVLVAASAFLACHAIRRIRVNMAYNKRPFTEKDRAYCKSAAFLSLMCSAVIAVGSLFFVHGARGHQIGVGDLVSAQLVSLLLVSGVLYLLADVHKKGAELHAELESGV